MGLSSQPSRTRRAIGRRCARLASWVATLTAVLLTSPALTRAVSLSGILLYSTDDFGNPSGWDETTESFAHKQLWRTRVGGIWHALGVFAGLPPESLGRRPLNAPDFTLELPLYDGENVFTLLGEPTAVTAGDDFLRFALNLYLDGVTEYPGISVLFSRDGPPSGELPAPNPSGYLFALSLEPMAQGTSSWVYEDGTVRVSVSGVSFLSSETVLPVDLMSPHAVAPSGHHDWFGVLTIRVEPLAESNVGRHGFPRSTGPGAFGIVPGQGLGAKSSSDAPHGDVARNQDWTQVPATPRPEPTAAAAQSEQGDVDATPASDVEATPVPTQPSRGEGTTTPAATASLAASAPPTSRTQESRTTPTPPKATQFGSTPTANATAGTPAAQTPGTPSTPIPTS